MPAKTGEEFNELFMFVTEKILTAKKATATGLKVPDIQPVCFNVNDRVVVHDKNAVGHHGTVQRKWPIDQRVGEAYIEIPIVIPMGIWNP